MKHHTLEHYRHILLQQEQELREMQDAARDASQPVELEQSTVGRLSRMDAMQSQAMAQENRRRREIQLMRISAALERIESGDFGYCAGCDEEIPPGRLDADPANPFCVHCAANL